MAELKKLKLDKIIPYENNPRDNEIAIEAVATSIERYGYNQPIVVDENYMIIVGHTRHLALKRLVAQGNKKYRDIPVLISEMPESLAREHRIADNKTGELSTWYTPYLRAELRDVSDEEAREMFTEGELNALREVTMNPEWQVTEEEIAAQRQRMEDRAAQTRAKQDSNLVEVTCEHCSEKFFVSRQNAVASADMDENKIINDEAKAATSGVGEET